jgi:hypothetical protein
VLCLGGHRRIWRSGPACLNQRLRGLKLRTVNSGGGRERSKKSAMPLKLLASNSFKTMEEDLAYDFESASGQVPRSLVISGRAFAARESLHYSGVDSLAFP